ncbi:hypothetical protein BDV34DRAFT_205678 [Aspergillus parasiticus]|uniref:Uncharacterized protein n=1 Tax=Aspergillus parasiticus TaxID=5067 RepID=A0A5N6D424_ASPPA|nr:hypothetical protein BDV34DRAFT_205678 [Aspergillus parasiticus]
MPADPKQTIVPDGESVTKPTGHKQTLYKICKNKKAIKPNKIADMTKEERTRSAYRDYSSKLTIRPVRSKR